MHKVKCKALPDTMTSMFNVNNNSIYNVRSNNTDYAFQKQNTNFMKKVLLIPVLVCGIVYIEISKGSNAHLSNLGQFPRAINDNSSVFIM